MARVTIRDDVLWAHHIDEQPLRERIVSLEAGQIIELEVDGIVGRWEKIRVGSDGRTQDFIKPIGSMREIWKRFQNRQGEQVEIREVRTADSYLSALTATLSEWDSPEDEEAFGDL